MPKCKQGDLAFIRKSMNLKNIGLIVECKSYIGKFEVGEEFSFHGVLSVAIIGDHFWEIYSPSKSINVQEGKTSVAFAPDTWLTPINPEGLGDEEDLYLELTDEMTV